VFAIWGDYFRFLRRPVLPDVRVAFGPSAVADVALLLILDLFIVSVFLAVVALAENGGVELPQPVSDELGPREFFVVAVLIAPPLEEWLFRAGLSGSRRSLIGVAITWPLLLALAAAALLGTEAHNAGWIFLAWVAVTAVLLALVQRPIVPVKFAHRFPYFFWLSALAFGVWHIFNYEEPLSLMPLAMVIPQFTGGTILAYARVKYGMWANVAQHATFNAIMLGLHFAWPDQFQL
jgi:membrane protease YdiL (CAAX protease family)